MGTSQSSSSTTSDKPLERDDKRRGSEERSDTQSQVSEVLLKDCDYFGEKPFKKRRSSAQKRIVEHIRKRNEMVLSTIRTSNKTGSKPPRRRSWQVKDRIKTKHKVAMTWGGTFEGKKHRRSKCSNASSFAEPRRPLAERFREFLTRTRLEHEPESPSKEATDEEVSRIPFKRTSSTQKPKLQLESGRAERPRDRTFIPTEPKYDGYMSDLEVRSDGFLTFQEQLGIDTSIDWQLVYTI